MTDVLDEVLANLPLAIAQGKEFDRPSAERELAETCETVQRAEIPRIYQLETTSRCNLECPFCPRTTALLGKQRRDLNRNMTLVQFTRILNQLPHLRSLELFHFGEPFMHREIPSFVQECTDRGILTVIASNLLPATEERIDAVFDAGLYFLVMDVDSLDPERYAKARVNGSLQRLQPIVRYILDHPHRPPFVVAQTIQLGDRPEYGLHEFMAWSQATREPDEIRYKFLDSFRGEAAAKGSLGPKDLCREPFYGCTIHVNGDVVPCDRDWAGDNVMGNAFETPLQSIWEGERFEAFREKMKSEEKPEMCRSCPEGRLVNLRSQPHIQVNMFSGKEIEHR